MADLLLWALEHGITLGLVAFLLALPVAVLGVAYLWLMQGARTIAAGWVWVQLFRWLRDRRHPGGAGGHSREYTAFMASPEWRRQRERVLRRDAHRCQQCGGRGGLEAHHQWYGSPLRDTPDWACVTLCGGCHAQAHGRG